MITNVPATSVEFFAAGVSLGVVSVSSNPTVDTDWRLYLEPTEFPNGALQLSASATNADGTSSAASTVSVTIDNPDSLGPAIGTVSPARGGNGHRHLRPRASPRPTKSASPASYSLDGTTFLAMHALGGGAFTADIDSTSRRQAARSRSMSVPVTRPATGASCHGP